MWCSLGEGRKAANSPFCNRDTGSTVRFWVGYVLDISRLVGGSFSARLGFGGTEEPGVKAEMGK